MRIVLSAALTALLLAAPARGDAPLPPSLTGPLQATYAQAWLIVKATHPGWSRPPLDFTPLASMQVEAEVYDGAIHPSPWMLGPMDQQGRADAASTLIHEIAHVFQRPGMPTWMVEGGAEAFARTFDWKVADRFGPFPNAWAYDGYVRRVHRELGDRWIRRGQFR